MSRKPFFPVDCDYKTNPKFIMLRELAGAAYPGCVLLWLDIGTFCAGAMTAGIITMPQLRELCHRPQTLDHRLEYLMQARLIETQDRLTYSVHNWELHNFSADEIADQRVKRKERNRRYRQKLKSKSTTKRAVDKNAHRNDERNDERNFQGTVSVGEIADKRIETANTEDVRRVSSEVRDAPLPLYKTQASHPVFSDQPGTTNIVALAKRAHSNSAAINADGLNVILQNEFHRSAIPPSLWPEVSKLAPFSRYEIDYAWTRACEQKGKRVGVAYFWSILRGERETPPVSVDAHCETHETPRRKTAEQKNIEDSLKFALHMQAKRKGAR